MRITRYFLPFFCFSLHLSRQENGMYTMLPILTNLFWHYLF